MAQFTNFIGFETANSQELSGTGGSPAYSGTYKHSGSYGCYLSSGDLIEFLVDPFNLESGFVTVHGGGYFKFSGFPITDTTSAVRIYEDDESTSFPAWGILSDGKIRVYDAGGSTAGTSTNSLSTGTEYKIEWFFYQNSISGRCSVKVNGSTWVDATSMDSDNGGQWYMWQIRNDSLSDWYVDDLYAWASTGSYVATNALNGDTWEIPGYYQPVTGGISTGTSPGAGSIANLGENPLNESNGAEWQNDGDDADFAADGTRAGPTTDIDGTVILGKWWYRAEDEGNVDTYLQHGKYDSTPTWTHTEHLYALTNSPDDYFIISDSNVPSTTSESFAWGIRISGSKDSWLYEVGAWFLQTAATGTNYQRSISDSVGITDSVSAVIGRLVSITDSVGITDAIALAREIARTFSEPVGVTDTVSTSRNIFKSLADSVGITDAVTTARDLVISLSDSIGITDTITAALKKIVALADSVGITDTLSTVRALAKTISDSIGITDTISTARDIVKSLSDNVGITDTITTARGLVISLADSIGITDAITAIKGALAKYVTITDTVGITDSLATVRALSRTVTDSIGITDTLTTARDIVISFSDSVGITDVVTGYRKIFVTLADNIGITDTIGTVVTFVAQKILKTIIGTLGIIGVIDTQQE